MRIIATVCSAILVMEFVLHGLAMFIGMEAGIDPLTKHFGFRPERWLVLLLGTFDAAAAALLVLGWWHSSAAVLGAAYALGFFGLMLVLRFHRHLGGILPPDFPLFFTLGAVVLVLSLLR
ncbi:hypothetical protein [Micromonospora sp. LH3U1]|uniref:hypothetical protein n=1 Tax=Micromonospora sp. LH3U1 TaxID=3018339 RepID=UPI00234B0E11|nr:hypothetical protein [Micromonospora sp. LH3U1]WCN83972.1 hypothetical protein PCA76_13435 [Micromonospora sp. LH3U1]